MNCPICEVKLIGHRDYLYCPQCQCNYYPKVNKDGTLVKDETNRNGILLRDVPEMYPPLREYGTELSFAQRLLISEIKITNLEQELKDLRSQLLG